MLSAAQQQYVDNMVLSMYMRGYEYYLIQTNINTSGNTVNNWKDLILYFSKEPINEISSYRFSVPKDTIKMEVITGNASRTNTEVRYYETVINAQNITINTYEHILTNAPNTHYMNVLASEEYNQANNIAYNIDVSFLMIGYVLIAVILLYNLFKTAFPNVIGD